MVHLSSMLEGVRGVVCHGEGASQAESSKIKL
jgi:hypothetical protein